MFLPTYNTTSVEKIVEVGYLLHGSLTTYNFFQMVSCLERMMGLCDVARVVGSTLLDIGRLSDLFANNQLLNQTLEPAVADALLHRNISN